MQSEDDVRYLQRVAAAVEAQLDPSISGDRRGEANQVLLQVRAEAKATLYALHLMRPAYSSAIRFFGCTLLAEQIELRWRSDGLKMSESQAPYTTQQQGDLVRMLFNMFQGSPSDALASEPMHLKEKTAQVMALIVLRQWPRHDASLLLSILNLADVSYEHLLVASLILRQLADAIVSLSTVPQPSLSTKHLTDAGSALTEFALNSPCFSTFYNYLERIYSESLAAPQPRHLVLIHSVLRMLQAWADIVPLPLFFVGVQTGQHSFAQVSVLLLGVADLAVQQAAADLLVILYSRCVSTPADRQSSLFLFDHIETISGFVSSLVATLEAARAQGNARLWISSYQLFKRMVQLCVLLGVLHLDSQWPDELPPFYAPYLQLMLDVSCFGSLQVIELVVPFWRRWFADERLHKYPAMFKPAVDTFLRNSRLLYLSWPYENWPHELSSLSDNQLAQLHAYQVLDFEDKSEWQRAFGSVRSEMTELFRSICQRESSSVLRCAHDLAQLSRSMAPAITTILLDGISRILKSVNTAITSFDSISAEMEAVLTLIFDLQPRTGPELIQAMSCIKNATKFYAGHPSWMERAVIRTLESATKAFSGDQFEREARRQACIAFSHLGTVLAEHLLPHLESIANIARPIVGDHSLLPQDRMMILEGLASVAAAAPSDVASALLSDLLCDPLQQYQSDAVKSMCSSLPSFSAICGLSARLQRDSDAAILARNNRNQLQTIMQTLTVIWKKTAKPMSKEPHPLSPHDPSLLQTTCMLIKTLNSLLQNDIIETMRKEYSADFLYEPEDHLVKAWLRRDVPDRVVSCEQEIRSWIWNLRDTCMMLATAIASHVQPFFGAPAMILSFHDAFLHCAESMQPLHMIQLLSKTITPTIKLASTAAVMGHLTPEAATQFLLGASILTKTFSARISIEWNAYNSRWLEHLENYRSAMDMDDFSVVMERALRSASLEISHLIESILLVQPPEKFSASSDDTASPLFQLALNLGETSFITDSIMSLLQWSDTSTLNHILTTLSKLIPIVSASASAQRDGLQSTVPMTPVFLTVMSKHIFSSLINLVLRAHTAGIPVTTAALNLIRDIWQIKPEVSSQVLVSLHGSNSTAVAELQKQLRNVKTKNAARNVFKAFFKSVLGTDLDGGVNAKTALDVKQFTKVLTSMRMKCDAKDSEELEAFPLFD